jgi:hypothetical protein
MKLLTGVSYLMLAGTGIYATQRWLDQRIGEYRTTEEAMYLPDPAIIKRLTLGYESLVADLYWLRTVQYYGGKRRDVPKENYDLLEPLLRITIGLDPQMILAYRFGAIFLSEPQPIGAGESERALSLLDEGMRKNPDSWELIFDKGFVFFWQLKDYHQAAAWFLRGSRHPKAPEWLGSLAAFSLEKGGDIETAKYLWRKQYEESGNERMRANALAHLRSIQVDEDLWTLEFLLKRFVSIHKRNPASWDELMRAGLLKMQPLDPLGNAYMLDSKNGVAQLSPQSSLKRFELPSELKSRYLQRLATSAAR